MADGLKHLASPGNIGARTAVNAGVGGVTNVMAGDENSNAFSRFAVGAGLGAAGGHFLKTPIRRAYRMTNNAVSPTLRNWGTQATNTFNSSMRGLAKQTLPSSGNSPFMQNMAGAAYRLRRHPVLAAGAAATPYFMYNGFNEGRQQTLDAAEQAGTAGGNAAAEEMMSQQGMFPGMMAAMNPGFAADALKEKDPGAYNQYMLMKAMQMQNQGIPHYAR